LPHWAQELYGDLMMAQLDATFGAAKALP
jgi:hypothetical protein